MKTARHPHSEQEFKAMKSAGDEPSIDQICHAYDNQHNVRDLIDRIVTIYEASPVKSDFGSGSYATIRVDNGDGQSVYLVGGNAGMQAISFGHRGMLPMRRILSSLEVNNKVLLYWRKITWADRDLLCPDCDGVLMGDDGQVYCPVCENVESVNND